MADRFAVCVVATIGFGPRLPLQMYGLLRRSGWTSLHFPDVAAALDVLQRRIRPDVIVLEGDAVGLMSDADLKALRVLAGGSPSPGGLPLVVVSRRGQPADQGARLALERVYRVRGPGSYYQHLGALIRLLVDPTR